jgi:hypothetical protein
MGEEHNKKHILFLATNEIKQYATKGYNFFPLVKGRFKLPMCSRHVPNNITLIGIPNQVAQS